MPENNIQKLLNKLRIEELRTLDKLLKDVADTSNSPSSQNRLEEWINYASAIHGIEQQVAPRRKRSLSL